MNDYHIILFYSPEDEAWIADIPNLRYCSAHGDTPQEALEATQAEGRPIPRPRYRPAVDQAI
jgi:predicted RNase H-like HicB family nuclease